MEKISKYKKLFIDESRELLQNLSKNMLIFEKKPEDKAVLNEIFRSVHTLKGDSNTIGYHAIGKLSHSMENIFDMLRKGGTIDSTTIDILFDSVNTLELLIEDVASGSTLKRDISALHNRLEKNISPVKEEEIIPQKVMELNLSDAEERQINYAKENGMNCFNILVILSDDCGIISARSIIVLKETKDLGNIIKTIPDLMALKSGSFEKQFEIIVTTKYKQEEIKKLILDIPEIENVEVSIVTTKESVIKEAVIQQSRPPTTIRVDIEKIWALQNLIEELSISKIRLAQISAKHDIAELNDITVLIDRLVSELQDSVLQMRMFPIGYLFDRFPRTVRSISKKQGKEVDFIIEGRGIELDRLVQDEINDAIMHLLHNAIDHGIETTEKRKKLGKAMKGKIVLSALREGNNIIISVSDDGRGIHKELIKNVAIKKKIITQEESLEMTRNEIFDLLGEPGLSTKKKITDISGRGVGFDVVKSKIKSLGGAVRITSEKNEGTMIELKLPLTTAIIQSLLVSVHDEKYAVPLDSIKEIVAIASNELKSIDKREVFTYREDILPLLRLNTLLNVSGDNNKNGPIIVVEKNERYFGMMVDMLIAQQETVIKPLEGILKGRKEFTGSTILGDGTVALILDIEGLIGTKHE